VQPAAPGAGCEHWVGSAAGGSSGQWKDKSRRVSSCSCRSLVKSSAAEITTRQSDG